MLHLNSAKQIFSSCDCAVRQSVAIALSFVFRDLFLEKIEDR